MYKVYIYMHMYIYIYIYICIYICIHIYVYLRICFYLRVCIYICIHIYTFIIDACVNVCTRVSGCVRPIYNYGVATMSRLLKIIGLFSRISSLL